MRLLLLVLIALALADAQLINIPDALGPILEPLVPPPEPAPFDLEPEPVPEPSPTPSLPSLWELLALTPSLSNFTEALDKIGMRETLSNNDRHLTVFAPSNTAFENFFANYYDEKNEPPDFASLISNHVNGISINTTQMVNDVVATTGGGDYKRFNIYAPYIYINGIARIDLSAKSRDRRGSNGYLQRIDAMLPPLTEIEKMPFSQSFSMPNSGHWMWSQLMRVAEVEDELNDIGYSYTFFVPDEQALARMPYSRSYLRENPAVLQSLLLYHLVPSTYFEVGLRNGTELLSLSRPFNETLKISKIYANGVIQMNVSGVPVTKLDQIRRNGVMHVLSNVLVPPGFWAPPPTLLDVIEAQPQLRRFYEFTREFGFRLLLNDHSLTPRLTVFAPDNEAIDLFLDMYGASELERSLKLHIYINIFLETGGINNNDYYIDPETGFLTRFNWYNGLLYLNGAVEVYANSSNLEASNGLVHIVSAVLKVPTRAENDTVYNYITSGNSSLFFAAGLLVTDSHELLYGDGTPHTVFLPTDEAFRSMKAGFLPALFSDLQKLTEIVRYHIVPGAYYRAGLASENQLNTYFRGATLLSTSATEGEEFINNTPLRNTILRRNGIIYPIREILIPPGYEFPLPSIYEIIVASADLSILASSLNEYGLTRLYNASVNKDGHTNNTIFAPTDAAFIRFADLSSSLTNAQIRSILLYHVEIASVVRLGNISNDMVIYSGNGLYMKRFNIYGGRYYINGEAEISIGRSSPATNGYIHVLDAVLSLPPVTTQVTIATYLINDNRFNTTLAMLDKALLVNLLNVSTVPTTLFAPTERAWSQLDSSTLNALLEDESGSLQHLLRYHVAIGTYFPVAFRSGLGLPTLSDKKALNVTYKNETLTLNGVSFQLSSIFVQNGIIYAIDRVIEPPQFDFPDGSNSTEYFIPTDEPIGRPNGLPAPLPPPTLFQSPSAGPSSTPTGSDRVVNAARGFEASLVLTLTLAATALIMK